MNGMSTTSQTWPCRISREAWVVITHLGTAQSGETLELAVDAEAETVIIWNSGASSST